MLLVFSLKVIAQNRIVKIEQELEALKIEVPALENKIEISVDEVELEEFLRGLAVSNKLNINVDNGLDIIVTNNFIDVSLADILVFLVKEFDLDLNLIGNIINISKYIEPTPEVAIEKPPPSVIYQKEHDLLSLDLRGHNLFKTLKDITRESGKNVIAIADVENIKVNSYILNVPFRNALEKLAMTNNLDLTVSGDGFFIISKKKKETSGNIENKKKTNRISSDFELHINDNDLISLKAVNQPISEIIKSISNQMGKNYYMLSEAKALISINAQHFKYDDFLDYVFNATEFTYTKTNGVYVFGKRKEESLRETKIVELQHRSVENLAKQIPEEIKKGVSIAEFNELNSLILSGSAPEIAEIENFLNTIDKVVPVVLIEVLIIDYSSGHTVTAGIKAGIGNKPAPTSSGQLYPSTNYNMNASSVNNLIQSLNGFGWFKLGKVTPNFYLQIQALEDQGVLKVRSTPKLATLNGFEANLTIGNTEYYAIESNNVIGSQNPQNIITRSYQSVRADLTVTIKPFVSGDEQITLDITVEQSDFSARISPDAPPGSVTRSFSSLIRVKNGEMILLGGLEQKSTENAGSGLPILSRIPVIKWFFSSRTKSRKSDKLNIFIKPTVFY